MKKIATPPSAATEENPIRERIRGAAFKAFTEHGYAGTSTLEIATRAKVSKRDLYANFGSKDAILVACIKSRADRMRLPPELPAPRDRGMLTATLAAFAANILTESSHPAVIAMFRLAIAEAHRSPEIAEVLENTGRVATRQALADLFERAQSARLIGAGDPLELAIEFLALVWEGLLVNLLLGLALRPKAGEIERRAAKAAAAFMRLHPEPPARQCYPTAGGAAS